MKDTLRTDRPQQNLEFMQRELKRRQLVLQWNNLNYYGALVKISNQPVIHGYAVRMK